MVRARALLASLVVSMSGCSAGSECSSPSDRSMAVLRPAYGSPVIALAYGESDLGLVYVERPPWPLLAHFVFQRLSLEGSALGDPVPLSPVDQAIPGTVTITHDGGTYLACTVIVGGASCFRVDAADAPSEDVMIVDATALSIARGASGVLGAWIEGGALHTGPLGTSVSTIATTDAPASIAPNDHGGFVVGYRVGATAFVVTLDAAGRATHSTALGPALATASVVVATASGATGASWIGPSGEAEVAVLDASGLRASTLEPDARSLGPVAIAPSGTGFFATWSDSDASIRGARVDLDGAVLGARYAHDVGRTDASHALVALDLGFALAMPTTRDGTPVHVARLGCP